MGPDQARAGRVISPNHDARPDGAAIDHLVLHYTGMVSARDAIERLCDPVARVSSHYVIDEDGAVHALVPEERRAWHAGTSYWRGSRGLNDRSIGIEIVNPGHEWGYRPFPAVQIEAVVALCRGILGRHAIPSCNVVGHSDIAPDRKRDPGELFPWRHLAGEGIGLWRDGGEQVGELDADLSNIGYDTALDPAVVISAFQRRFRPSRVDGFADEETRARAAAIRALFASDR